MGRILNWVMVWVVVLGGMFAGDVARGAEVIPPLPGRYFNDYAKVVSPQVGENLNAQLERFEKDTSNQVRVAIFPKMESDSSIDDYTERVAERWGFGKKKVNNGIVLFVFTQERQAFIQVGYGLEGALPDASAREIVELMKPLLKAGNYDSGIQAGVAAIIGATKTEYKGNGRTQAEGVASVILGNLPCIAMAVGAFLLFGLLLLVMHNFGGTFYQHHSRSLSLLENIYIFIFQIALNIVFSGGSSGSSNSSGSSSSGGGSYGGGGAGGSW